MEMKNVLSILFLATVMVFTACQEDDYEEIIGVCPIVVSTDPGNQAIGVSLDKIISVTFNTEMNPATINTSSMIVYGVDTIAGTLSYAGNTASFTPSANLTPFTTYTGTVTTAVKDITGNALQQKYIWTFNTGAAGVDMRTASRFGILAATGITSTGFSEVQNSDVGVSPGLRSSILGFPPAVVINGSIYAADDLLPSGIPAMLIKAHEDLAASYVFAASATSPSLTIVSGDLGGQTLAPGIYKSSGALMIDSGNLTLDAQGDINAYWIFQIASDFVTQGGSGGDVILTGGAQARNIYWQTGGAAILGNNTSFKGTILSLNTIRMNSDATIEGRLLSGNGTVVLGNTNTILKP